VKVFISFVVRKIMEGGVYSSLKLQTAPFFQPIERIVGRRIAG
jgi:hypothetical protein